MRPTQHLLLNKIIKNKPKIELAVGVKTTQNETTHVYTNNGFPLTKDARYEIGSLTKIFTSTLIAKLLYQQQLDLDATIDTYLPLEMHQYYPTIRRLATHCSGYPSFLPLSGRKAQIGIALGAVTGGLQSKNNPFENAATQKELLSIIENYPCEDKDYPYSYGNVNFNILGAIITAVTGKPYTTCMTEYIQNELMLKHTNFKVNNLLSGYFFKKNDPGNWLWNENETTIAAGGLYSTVSDLLKFAHLHNIESFPYLPLMHQKYAKGPKPFDMALGWKYSDKGNILWHDGGTGRFVSFMGMNRQTQKEVVILSNYRTFHLNELGFSLLNE